MRALTSASSSRRRTRTIVVGAQQRRDGHHLLLGELTIEFGMSHHPVDGASDVPEVGAIDDQSGRSVGPNPPVLVMSGKATAWPASMIGETGVAEIFDQRMLGGDGLLEWVLDRMATLGVVARPPPAFDADAASLDLDHDQAVARVDQDEVGFAIGGLPLRFACQATEWKTVHSSDNPWRAA